MRAIELVEHIGADMPSRHYADGRRISAADARDLKDRAERLECLSTKGRQLPGGRIRRTNYTTVRL
jgi:hypothetical protein